MTDLTTKLAEALRLCSVLVIHGNKQGDTAIEAAREALRLFDEAKAKRCQCGIKLASECEPWEPGCDLGQSPEHVRVHEAKAHPVQDERDFGMQEAPHYYNNEESSAWASGASHGYTMGFRAAMAAAPAHAPMTREQIKELIPEGDGWKFDVGFDEAINFARAIERACAEAWGVTLAGQGKEASK